MSRQEGRQEECLALVTRLLRRKSGIQLELDQSLTQLQTLPVEKLEDLTEAIFDWTEVSDLTEWLRQQLAGNQSSLTPLTHFIFQDGIYTFFAELKQLHQDAI